MSSPEKKRKMSLLLSLPDELLLICVARVSRLYYPALSLVSKRFRSLIASPDLHKTRSLLGITESCLYVYLNINYSYRMFTLSWKPDKTLTDDTKKSSGYVLATVPSPHSNGKIPCRVVAVGSNVYNIKESSPSCSVSILNCRSHTWHEAPVLQENLSLLLYADVVDQKICVTGTSFDVYGLKNDIAVFDTKTQSWDPMPIPCRETQGRKYWSNAYIDGKLHLLTDIGLIAYNSKEGRWDNIEVGEETWNRMYYSHSCREIEKVMYSLSYGEFTWYDKEVRMWRDLKGLVGLPELPYGAGVRYVDYGGKMMVLWEEDGPCYEPGIIKEKMIWCAEIALEKRENCEIWGIVEWFEHVLTVPYRCRVMDVVVATV